MHWLFWGNGDEGDVAIHDCIACVAQQKSISNSTSYILQWFTAVLSFGEGNVYSPPEMLFI